MQSKIFIDLFSEFDSSPSKPRYDDSLCYNWLGTPCSKLERLIGELSIVNNKQNNPVNQRQKSLLILQEKLYLIHNKNGSTENQALLIKVKNTVVN